MGVSSRIGRFWRPNDRVSPIHHVFRGTRHRISRGFAMSQLLQLYRSLGNERYAAAIAGLAPYFGTIDPKFKDLRPGYCAIEIPNTPAVHNHLGTLHAIAMCNGAELVAGLATDVSIPVGRRWIPI